MHLTNPSILIAVTGPDHTEPPNWSSTGENAISIV